MCPVCLPHLIDVESLKGAVNITKVVVAGWGRTVTGWTVDMEIRNYSEKQFDIF